MNAIMRLFAPYIVQATYMDGQKLRYKVHHAWTHSDALAWVQCYSHDDKVVIYHQSLWAWHRPALHSMRG